MKGNCERRGQPDKAGLRELLARDGREHLLPLVNVFALAGGALDQIIDVIGRAAIEAVLDISVTEVAGERQPGRKRDGVGAAYHGRQRGRVYLADRAVRVENPRLRNPGEVTIPAYEALRRPSGLGDRDAGTAVGRPEHPVLRQGGRGDGRDSGGKQVIGEPAGGGRAPQGAGGAAARRPGLSDHLR